MHVDAETGVVGLAECAQLFFDEPEDPAVLPTANPCFRVGVDRFVISCPVGANDYGKLWSSFQEAFPFVPLRCKRNRIRGLRTSIKVRDAPHTKCATSQAAPQIAAPVTVGLNIYHGRNGHYFGAHGNGRFTSHQWQTFHHLLTSHFPRPERISVSRIEAYSDFAIGSEYVAVLPLGAKHRICLQENGFYYGARSSNNSLVVYEGKHGRSAASASRYTHVEARLRARVEPNELVEHCLPFFRRFGVYLACSPCSMLHLPYAWRAADTRARARFLNRIEPYRVHVDEQRVSLAIEAFAAAVVPSAFGGAG